MERTEQLSRPAPRLGALLTAIALAIASGGCTVMSHRTSPLPQSGPTMTEIYDGHLAVEGPGPSSARDRLPRRAADADVVSAQTRAASDPLNNRFSRLPNPDMTMYVFPHLSPGNHPVPGYMTLFPMYTSVQYALPGEVAPREFAGTFEGEDATTAAVHRGAEQAQIKADRIGVVRRVSPSTALALEEFDRAWTGRCGGALTADELLAVPEAKSPAWRLMAADAIAKRGASGPLAGADQIDCGTGWPAAKGGQPSAMQAIPGKEPT